MPFAYPAARVLLHIPLSSHGCFCIARGARQWFPGAAGWDGWRHVFQPIEPYAPSTVQVLLGQPRITFGGAGVSVW